MDSFEAVVFIRRRATQIDTRHQQPGIAREPLTGGLDFQGQFNCLRRYRVTGAASVPVIAGAGNQFCRKRLFPHDMNSNIDSIHPLLKLRGAVPHRIEARRSPSSNRRTTERTELTDL